MSQSDRTSYEISRKKFLSFIKQSGKWVALWRHTGYQTFSNLCNSYFFFFLFSLQFFAIIKVNFQIYHKWRQYYFSYQILNLPKVISLQVYIDCFIYLFIFKYDLCLKFMFLWIEITSKMSLDIGSAVANI